MKRSKKRMTLTSKLQAKKLLVGAFAAVALSLSAGATASVSAENDNGNNGNDKKHGTSQTHQRADMRAQQSIHKGGNNSNHQTSGYGGTNVKVDQNVFVQIGNTIGSAIHITVNFVNNFFS